MKIQNVNEHDFILEIDELQLKFIFIEGGEFYMGYDSQRDGINDEYMEDSVPLHKAFVPSFWMSESLITHTVYEAVTGVNPCFFTAEMKESRLLSLTEPEYYSVKNQPIECVSWFDCVKFIHTLNEQLNDLKGLFKLPSEAQWEYAARGGKNSKNFMYAGSNSINDVGWSADRFLGTPQEIKKLLSNELGLYDLTGNLFEWCRTPFYPYESPLTNMDDAELHSEYAVRGGAWFNDKERCRNAYRFFLPPEYIDNNVGFRLVFERLD